MALRVPFSTLLAQTRAVKCELLCGFISQRSIPLDLNTVLSFVVSAAVLGKASVSWKRPDKEKGGPNSKEDLDLRPGKEIWSSSLGGRKHNSGLLEEGNASWRDCAGCGMSGRDCLQPQVPLGSRAEGVTQPAAENS